jgi:hypothetical protein
VDQRAAEDALQSDEKFGRRIMLRPFDGARDGIWMLGSTSPSCGHLSPYCDFQSLPPAS